MEPKGGRRAHRRDDRRKGINPITLLIKLRDYEPQDHAACVAVFDTNVGEYFTEGERAEFVQFLDEMSGPYLVLETGSGEVVGCGGYAFRDDGKTVDLCWGMVTRSRHREGLGRVLTEERLRRIEKEPAARSVRDAAPLATRPFSASGRPGVSIIGSLTPHPTRPRPECRAGR